MTKCVERHLISHRHFWKLLPRSAANTFLPPPCPLPFSGLWSLESPNAITVNKVIAHRVNPLLFTSFLPAPLHSQGSSTTKPAQAGLDTAAGIISAVTNENLCQGRLFKQTVGCLETQTEDPRSRSFFFCFLPPPSKQKIKFAVNMSWWKEFK